MRKYFVTFCCRRFQVSAHANASIGKTRIFSYSSFSSTFFLNMKYIIMLYRSGPRVIAKAERDLNALSKVERSNQFLDGKSISLQTKEKLDYIYLHICKHINLNN